MGTLSFRVLKYINECGSATCDVCPSYFGVLELVENQKVVWSSESMRFKTQEELETWGHQTLKDCDERLLGHVRETESASLIH